MSNKVSRLSAMLTAAIVIVKSNWRPWEKQQLVPTARPQNTKIWLEAGPALGRCSCIRPRTSGDPAPWCLG